MTADFESTLQKISQNDGDKKSQIYQHHIANSYGLKYNCDVAEYSEPIKICNSNNREELSKSYVIKLGRLSK